ncbi:MAG TPA: alpha/beta hydrolase [Gaiellaceae bacterium]|nr:alpha/beta hydrolase [Gaiellaceae bacterium]
MTLSSWLSAAEGDPSGSGCSRSSLRSLSPAPSFGASTQPPRCSTPSGEPPLRVGEAGKPFEPRRAATTFGWGGGLLSDAWPASPDDRRYNRVRTSNVETLLVSGELDITTPPQVARKELLPYLPNGEQVVLPGFGHSLDFWTYQPEASTRLLDTFFASGNVDDSLYEPQRVDFAPEVTQTVLAMGIAGTMVGLGLLRWSRCS